MLRPDKFEIQFDAPGAVYFATQTITGNVVLKVAEPLCLKGVKMRFRGECCIHFHDCPTKLRKLREGGKMARRRLTDTTSTSSAATTTTSNTWLSLHQNGHNYGIDNPGYIPDRTGNTEEQGGGEGGGGGVGGNGADRRRGMDWDGGHAWQRPKSTEGAWMEGSLTGPRQHYRAQETYFDCEFYIYGHKYQKDEKELLPAGVHEFPFAFNLPPNLPPSFNSDKGFIVYTAIAILDRPAAANLVQKAGFSLHSILDLNLFSQASSSSSSSKSKNLCCFCCQTGPITLAARIPRRGYVPGEKILVNAEVDNISSRNTRRTRLLLLQMILEPPLPSTDLRVSMPLTIGSVPLRNRFSSFLPPGETRRSSGLPGINYTNFPFYWFGECVFGPEPLESQFERITGMTEDYGPQFSAVTPFAPKYICYTTGNNVDENVR